MDTMFGNFTSFDSWVVSERQRRLLEELDNSFDSKNSFIEFAKLKFFCNLIKTFVISNLFSAKITQAL
jgi:hypothetical protein